MTRPFGQLQDVPLGSFDLDRFVHAQEPIYAQALTELRRGAIFGSPDDLKLRSCATLFAAVSPPGSVFARILRKCYGGAPDELTLRLLRVPD